MKIVMFVGLIVLGFSLYFLMAPNSTLESGSLATGGLLLGSGLTILGRLFSKGSL